MEQKNDSAQPEVEQKNKEQEVITPKNVLNEVLIPVKFNKEVKQLTAEQAAELAQKGLKFDAISQDYEALKELACKSKKTVTQFLADIKAENYSKRRQELLEKCSGDQALAEHILGLENSNYEDDRFNFEELRREFPQFTNKELIPKQVVENAELTGRSLLDEYLRYKLAEKKRLEDACKNEKRAELKSLGSQINHSGACNPETREFLKGLWK